MPHDDPPKRRRRRKIVIVGAGPAGLEAARVAGERGHDVVVFEAADDPGGQIRLTAQSPRRREMIGIIDWRMAQCEARGVTFRFNTWAEPTTVQAENPGCGDRRHRRLPAHRGAASRQRAGRFVLGHHLGRREARRERPALRRRRRSCRAASRRGHRRRRARRLEIMTPDRIVRAGSHGHEPRALHAHAAEARHRLHRDLPARSRSAATATQLVATIGSDYGGVRKERRSIRSWSITARSRWTTSISS